MDASWAGSSKKNAKECTGGVAPWGGWIARIARIGWYLSQLHPARRGAPDPLALRANPATVPGVKLVKLVQLVKSVKLGTLVKLGKLR